MSLSDNGLYEFGKYRLDANEKCLLADEERISLTPKVFEMLAVFLESGGKLVSKDDLMDKVWADSFVEESNLTFTIRQLRKLLDDDARNPKYIETVARRGYRFLPEVRKIAENSDETKAENHFQPKKFFRKQIVAGAFVCLLLTLGLSGYVYQKSLRRSAPILEEFYQTETVFNSDKTTYAAISPNGKYFAYIDNTNLKQSVWLKNLETENSVEIVKASDNNYYGLEFSQNSESVYFTRQPAGAEDLVNSIF